MFLLKCWVLKTETMYLILFNKKHLFFSLSFYLLIIMVQQVFANHPNEIFNNSIFSSNVYVGISPRMLRKERELEAAKRHIAHQIAMRERCIIDINVMQVSIRNFNTSPITDSHLNYDDPYIDEILENIEVINIFEYNELIVLIGRDISKPVISNTIIPRHGGSRPRWIDNPEWVRDILGHNYFVGVGIAQRYLRYYRGIFFADQGAAQAIASEKETFTYTFIDNSSANRSANIETGILSLTENVELFGFYIIDRWIEPDGSAYYSLGIAYNRGLVR